MIGNGARVKIHYRLSVEGRLIDSSEGREPLEYVHGAGQIVPGLESHLARLNPGIKPKLRSRLNRRTGLQRRGHPEHCPKMLLKIPAGSKLAG